MYQIARSREVNFTRTVKSTVHALTTNFGLCREGRYCRFDRPDMKDTPVSRGMAVDEHFDDDGGRVWRLVSRCGERCTNVCRVVLG